jgi:hypothetical protein
LALGNGLSETITLNKRMQPCRINVNSSETSLNSYADAIPSGNLQDFTYTWGLNSVDNGDVYTMVATG